MPTVSRRRPSPTPALAADGHLQSIKNAIVARIPLLCGTDLPPADDVGGLPSTVVELMLLEEAGLSRAVRPPDSDHQPGPAHARARTGSAR